jgi:transposase-like protein
MADDSEERYPLACPICTVAMIGETSDPERSDPDTFRCLNCGTVVLRRRKPPASSADGD